MRAPRRLTARILFLLLGMSCITGSAVAVFLMVPQALGPGAGDHFVQAENVRWWTPEDGWSEGTRGHAMLVLELSPGLRFEESINGIASPRGARFVLPVDARLEVVGEPGVHLAFPPTPLTHGAPHNVYLGVPWATPSLSRIGAIDNFTLTERTSIDGLAVNRYEARHVAQAFVMGDVIWHRATHRVALVEPLTGMVVDYFDHETLWTEETAQLLPLPFPMPAPQPLPTKEKVWESIVTPTGASRGELIEDARDARRGHFVELAMWGAPLLIVGEVFLGVALFSPMRRRK